MCSLLGVSSCWVCSHMHSPCLPALLCLSCSRAYLLQKGFPSWHWARFYWGEALLRGVRAVVGEVEEIHFLALHTVSPRGTVSCVAHFQLEEPSLFHMNIPGTSVICLAPCPFSVEVGDTTGCCYCAIHYLVLTLGLPSLHSLWARDSCYSSGLASCHDTMALWLRQGVWMEYLW